MKAKFVSESISFQRGIDPKEALGIGGFSFDTLRPGTILKSKKFFGVSKYGNLGGYHSSANSINPDSYLVVTSVLAGDKPKTKTIHWLRTRDLGRATDMSKRIASKEPAGIEGWYFTKGHFADLSKTRFNYRLEVIGGETTNESINFERGQDPKGAMGIGLAGSLFQKLVDNKADPMNPKYTSPVEVIEYEGGYILIIEQNPIIHERPNIYRFFTEVFDKDFESVGHTYTRKSAEEALKDGKHFFDEGVFESVRFNRGQDPKRAMGLGHITWENLAPGDILRPKQNFKINKDGEFIPPSKKGGLFFWEESPLVVIEKESRAVMSSSGPGATVKNGYRIHYYTCWTLEDAHETAEEIRAGTFDVTIRRKPINATVAALSKRLDILQPNEN